jgi:isoleucyl-tRNA synthetase
MSKVKIDEELLQLVKDELNVKEVVVSQGAAELKVELDTILTPELKAEGAVRELIRQVQELRKEKGCRLDEKIVIAVAAWPPAFEELIKKETLAVEIKKSTGVLSITTPSTYPAGV